MQVVHVPPFSGIGPEEPFYDPGYQNLLIGQGKPGDILRNLLLEVAREPDAWMRLAKDVEAIFQVELLPPNYTPGADPYIRVEYREATSRTARDTLDIASAGSGFHQVLALLAFFYARPAAMLLLDEPDAHQHVVLQRQVYDRLREVARLRGCQLLVATHSEVILDGSDAHDVLSMYGRPHVLNFDSDREQVREALRRLTTLDALSAESGLNVLYVEDESDFRLLGAFARVLRHRAETLFRTPFYVPLRGRKPQEAKAHFFAAKAVRKGIKGVLLLDGDNRGEPDHEIGADGLTILRWRRYEVESYLLHPAALLRYIEGPENPTLWGIESRRRAEEYITNELPKAVVSDPLGDHAFLQSETASKTFLPALFAAAGLGIRKADYYLVALSMRADEIPPEVAEKLDAIVESLSVASEAAPIFPPTTPPVPAAPVVVEVARNP
jgi:AAA domain, putative AbiEii toxin, Type IV TA system